MLCEQIMKTNVECVSPHTSLRDAARLMRDQAIGFLPVCDASMRVVGTLTDRDLALRVVAQGRSFAAPVETCMTRDVISCLASDDLEQLQELMERYQKSRIVCTDTAGRIAGVISLSDLMTLDQQSGAPTLSEVSARESRSESPLAQ